MGWHLVQEVLLHCPDIRYREFRVLIAIALDARDETRQGMPGTESLTRMASCHIRQTKQAVADLKTHGLIKTVRRAAPGVRAVYEVLPLCAGNCPNGCGHARTRSSADVARTRTGADSGVTGAAMSAHTQSLSPSHSAQSSLSAKLRAALPDLTDDEIESIQEGINRDTDIRRPAAWLAKVIANGEVVSATRRYLPARTKTLQRTARPASRRSSPTPARRCPHGKPYGTDGSGCPECPP